MKKQLSWALAGLGSFAVSLAVMAPLPVIAQQLLRFSPDTQLAGVSGTLWKGQIQRVTTPQTQLDNLSWTIAPLALLRGYLAADLETSVQSAIEVKGQCGISLLNNLRCAPLQANMAANDLPNLLPNHLRAPGLDGSFNAMLDDISWDRKGLPLANGDVVWNEAGVQQPVKMELGGQYRAKILTSDKAGEALNINLQSQDAAIVLSGTIGVEADGRYQADIFLKPAGDADPSFGDVLGMIAPIQADGGIKLKQNGQLPLPQTIASE